MLTVELEKLRLELSSDASLDCRFHRAIARMLSRAAAINCNATNWATQPEPRTGGGQ